MYGKEEICLPLDHPASSVYLLSNAPLHLQRSIQIDSNVGGRMLVAHTRTGGVGSRSSLAKSAMTSSKANLTRRNV